MYTVHLYPVCTRFDTDRGIKKPQNKMEYANIIDYIAPYRVYSKNINNTCIEYTFETFYDLKRFTLQIKKKYPMIKIRVNDELSQKISLRPFHASLNVYN